MKKLLFFIFCLTIIAQKNLHSMEKFIEESEVKPFEMINLVDALPNVEGDALLIRVIQLATHSDAKIEFSKDKTSCFQFGPQQISGKKSNRVTLYSDEEWTPSINLNSTQIEQDEEDYLFTVQCYHENVTQFGIIGIDRYIKTKYRIDDDAQEKRFMASASLETRKPFFDGPTNDIFIIAGNSKEIKEYEYYIGKFNSKSTDLYKQDINDILKENNKFNVTSPRIIGTLSALALCKTRNWNPNDPTDNKNRFALADDRGISIYEIEEAVEQSKDKAAMSVQQIGFGLSIIKKKNITEKDTCIEVPVLLKKISFITPKTLLGLSESGRLFSIALDKKWGTITLEPQTIKNNQGEILDFHTFALNPCKPHQVVLCTRGCQILYLNLKNCLNPDEKKVRFLMPTKRLPDSMWFYNTRLCLGNYSAIKTENYTLADLDLRLEKD